MPPKKGAPTKATMAKQKATAPAKSTQVSSKKSSAIAPTSAAETSKSVAPSKKRKNPESSISEPASKKTKSESAVSTVKPVAKQSATAAKATTATTKVKPTKTVAPKKAPATKKSTTKPAIKPTTKESTTAKKAAAEKLINQPAAPVAKTPAAPKKAPAPKIAATSKPAPAKKFGPAINAIPKKKLDIFVFGEGGAGELGLGALKFEGKKPIDVKRPRLNHRLSAKDVGVVSIAVGGMHCAALTHDNKILTWGVNDQGALGRQTTSEGKTKDITKDDDDSDSDSDDEDSGLNPSECEPREVDSKHFPPGTKFAGLVASDSATFAITEEGLVYGWGTFRGNDGVLGFRSLKDIQYKPVLIPELKKITALAAGTNHILALDQKGKVYAWGAGEQNQLARRVVQRTAAGALIPREFGLKGQTVHIGCGNYHSFAVNKDGTVRAWGLNSWGECGTPKDSPDDNSIVEAPTVVENLKGFAVKQIDGGGHHSIAVTESGQVLTWGRIDLSQGGMEVSKYDKNSIQFDDYGKARYLTKPAVIPGINGDVVSAGTDSCLVITKEGKAYSWGFSSNYQAGQGDLDDVKEATLIDNTAVRGKKLCWAGAGGQFSVLCGEAEDKAMADA